MYTKEEVINLVTKKMVVYKITNLIDGKIYIGQTVRTFNERYNETGVGVERVFNCLKTNYTEKCERLRNALIEYGTNNFKVEILCQCKTVDELKEREEYYITLYGSRDCRKGYNNSLNRDNKRKGINWRLENALCQNTLATDGEKPKDSDLQFFNGLFKNKRAITKKEVIELLYTPVIYIVKNRDRKYYYYSSLRECCFQRGIEIKDGFCMAMRRRIDNRSIKALYPKVPISEHEIVFAEDIEIEEVQFENKHINKEEVNKNKSVTIQYKKCPHCGKQINSRFKMCADCKRNKAL